MAKKKVFVSYSSSDKYKVRTLAEDIGDAGFGIWLDRYQLGPTEEDWSKTIYNNISECDAFILFTSPAALKSKWVRLECAAAEANNISHSIVRLKTCAPVHKHFGSWWDENSNFSIYDLRSGKKQVSDWDRIIMTADEKMLEENGLPKKLFYESEWQILWRRYQLPKENEAWKQHQLEPDHIRNLDQLESVLSFFSKTEPDKKKAADYIMEYLKKYSCSYIDGYQKWYNFVSMPETHLSSNILWDNAHKFSMRMTNIDPEPVLSMFKRFVQKGMNHDDSWIHAMMASYGAIYE